jgi:pimeloyl-ACP methyl ester carboxylesterase
MPEIEACADLVAALLRSLGVGPLPVLGYSLGGYTGLELCLRHPDLVSRALLTSFQAMPLGGRWWMGPVLAAVAPVMSLRWARRGAFRAMGVPLDGSWAPGPAAPCSAATLRRIGTLAFTYDRRAALRDLAMPVLALAGDEELPGVRETVTHIAAQAPAGRGAIAPGGHGWPAVEPALFAATVRAWLADGPLPDGLRPV